MGCSLQHDALRNMRSHRLQGYQAPVIAPHDVLSPLQCATMRGGTSGPGYRRR